MDKETLQELRFAPNFFVFVGWLNLLELRYHSTLMPQSYLVCLVNEYCAHVEHGLVQPGVQ